MARPPSIRRPAAPALLVLAAVSLAGCLTPSAQPTPSAAVAEARKAAGAKAAACQVGGLSDISPTVATFPFDDPKLDDVGTRRLTAAVAWLNCNPGVPVAIVPTADNHGTAQHMQELAVQRGQAVAAALRELGAANAVIHNLAPGAPDNLAGPHLVIQADGRGW